MSAGVRYARSLRKNERVYREEAKWVIWEVGYMKEEV